MFKNFKKKSLKSKVAIIAFIVVILALTAYVLYSNFKPEPPAEYDVAAVAYGTVSDTLDVSGTVESGLSETFTAIEGVTVEELLVSVGDKVEKGDKLASFNVSGASGYLNDAKKEYDKALADYNNAKNSTDSTAKRKNELQSQIDAKNKEIAKKQKEIEELEQELESAGTVTQQTAISEEQIAVIAAQLAQNGATEEQIEAFITAASQVQIPTVSADTEKTQQLLQKNLELAQLNSQLTALQAENTVTVSTDNDTMLSALKSIADTKKQAYDELKNLIDTMENGWYAQNTGIVTVVNLSVGSKFTPPADNAVSQFDLSALLGGQSVDGNTSALISSLLGGSDSAPTGVGIIIESYDDLAVTVTVGKSDLLKIKKGMTATVTSLNSEYEGEVVYVGATASGSSGLDLSSLMGGTGSSGGAVVKVKIKNPDENVVIGFDVDIKINLQQIDNVIKIPVECVVYNNGEYYVYIYDTDGQTATRRNVILGALDDTSYEIIEGLSEGERVVKSPDPNMEDGTKIKQKTA
ncbi:MAG: hypothetical protein J1F23_03145 [Oscillospiraceae bacterium]|nr:hypothetical protein [Oscillospiraceae bacterium]